MLLLVPLDILREILAELNPIVLYKLRVVSKRLQQIIDDASTRTYIYRKLYPSATIPPSLKLNDLIYNYVEGAEKFHSISTCLAEACRRADLKAIVYFRTLVKHEDYIAILKANYALACSTLTKEQLVFIREHYYYSLTVTDIYHYRYFDGLSNCALGPPLELVKDTLRGLLDGGHDIDLECLQNGYQVTFKQKHYFYTKYNLVAYVDSVKARVYNEKVATQLLKHNLVSESDFVMKYARILPYANIVEILLKYNNITYLLVIDERLSFKQPSFIRYILDNHAEEFRLAYSKSLNNSSILLMVLLSNKKKIKQEHLIDHLERIIFQLQDNYIYSVLANKITITKRVLIKLAARTASNYNNLPTAHLRLNNLINSLK